MKRRNIYKLAKSILPVKEYSYVKRALLRELSENSRIPVTALAKKMKCSRNTILNNMKFLEKEFGLYYTLELDRSLLGFVQNYIITVKFDSKPDRKDIMSMLKESKFAFFAAETEGDFDLLMKMVINSGEEYIDWSVRALSKLLPFRPTIKTSIVNVVNSGFIPIGNEVLRNLDISKLRLDRLDKKIIMLLNGDSRISYIDMANILKEDVETVRYRMKKISKTGLIHKFTVVLKKAPINYNIAFFLEHKYTPSIFATYRNSIQYYKDLNKTLPIINTFGYLATLSGSYTFFGIGCFENEENAIKGAIIAHKNLYENDDASLSYAKITNVIVGNLPIRNMDVEGSLNFPQFSGKR
ncbi:MAG: Lrp/AsnC family transcriptional regulator [Candidatus Micrarchaeota archaeon]|nr:Lrp/AsnC family transcriptional regulator [Candidatus Micrarchaeota archaeon]